MNHQVLIHSLTSLALLTQTLAVKQRVASRALHNNTDRCDEVESFEGLFMFSFRYGMPFVNQRFFLVDSTAVLEMKC